MKSKPAEREKESQEMTKIGTWMVLFLLVGGLALAGQSKYNKIDYKGRRVKAACEITTRYEVLEKKANTAINMLLLQIEASLSVAEEGKREQLADELLEDTLKALERVSRDAIKKIDKESGGAVGTGGNVASGSLGGVPITGNTSAITGSATTGGGGGAAASAASASSEIEKIRLKPYADFAKEIRVLLPDKVLMQDLFQRFARETGIEAEEKVCGELIYGYRGVSDLSSEPTQKNRFFLGILWRTEKYHDFMNRQVRDWFHQHFWDIGFFMLKDAKDCTSRTRVFLPFPPKGIVTDRVTTSMLDGEYISRGKYGERNVCTEVFITMTPSPDAQLAKENNVIEVNIKGKTAKFIVSLEPLPKYSPDLTK